MARTIEYWLGEVMGKSKLVSRRSLHRSSDCASENAKTFTELYYYRHQIVRQ